MTRHGVLRVSVGVLASVYAASALAGLRGVGSHAGQDVQTITLWPQWALVGGNWLNAVVHAAMLVGGVGSCLRSRWGMRLLFWTLVINAAEEVLFVWPTLVAVGAGRVSGSWQASASDVGHYARIGTWLALSESVLLVLLMCAAAAWVRRETARTADRDHSG
jgi:hypothetical protein